MINHKYKVIDTLYTDELQSVYICADIDSDKNEKYIVGEFRGDSIIKVVKDSFILSGDDVSKSMTETFDIGKSFYIVYPVVEGIVLEEFLSGHKLTIANKMHITNELLKKFMSIDRSSYPIQYVLCDLNNLSVQNKKYISFNNLFFFKSESLSATSQDVIKRLGHIILCIFVNSPNPDIDRQKDILPPAIFSIIEKSNNGEYSTVNDIYDEFKKTLLYTTFLDTKSLDSQIRNRIQKAQKKRGVPWGRYIASLLIIAFLLRGGFWLVANRDIIPIFSKEPVEIQNGEEVLPIAEFAISINKIYEDNEISFIDKSRATDTESAIKSRLWTIEKDGIIVMSSQEKVLSYIFDKAGEYIVSLTVEDSKGNSSKPYTHNISVLERPDFPEDLYIDLNMDNSEDRK